MDQDCQDQFVEHFLKTTLPKKITKDETKFEDVKSSIKMKPIMLNAQKSNKKKKRKTKSKQRIRCIKPGEACNQYKVYETLRKLWKEYISELLHSCYVAKNTETLLTLDTQHAQDLLLKADYHGAELTVAKSPCSAHIGVIGTVIQETKNMFILCTQNNKIIKIPKNHTVFALECPGGFRTFIFGSQFCIKPSFRLTKRFKNYASLSDLM